MIKKNIYKKLGRNKETVLKKTFCLNDRNLNCSIKIKNAYIKTNIIQYKGFKCNNI